MVSVEKSRAKKGRRRIHHDHPRRLSRQGRTFSAIFPKSDENGTHSAKPKLGEALEDQDPHGTTRIDCEERTWSVNTELVSESLREQDISNTHSR